MKKVFKFINAGLFLISMSLIFVKCIEVPTMGISMFDLTKLGLELDSMLGDVISSGDAIFWAILTIMIAFAAFLGFIFSFLPPTAAYIFDMIFALGSGLLVIATYGLHFMIQSDSYAGAYVVKHGVFLLWILIFVAIFVMSIVGLAIKDKKKKTVSKQNYTASMNVERPVVTQQTMSAGPQAVKDSIPNVGTSDSVNVCCPYCGAKLYPNARFCGKCGNKLS